jgi:putative transposase
LGFVDESSQDPNANTQRVYSIRKLKTKRRIAHIKANSIGCYMLNGCDIIRFPVHTKSDDFCKFLENVREFNPEKRICLILDNLPVHKSKKVQSKAMDLNIQLIYLPPYSPDLNPIEFIWKSIKRIISVTSIENTSDLISLVDSNFILLTKRLTFARNWIEQFLGDNLWMLC